MTYQMDTLRWEAVQVFISQNLPVDMLVVKSYLRFFLPISLWHSIWPSKHHWNPWPSLTRETHGVFPGTLSITCSCVIRVTHTGLRVISISHYFFNMPLRPSQYILDFKYRYIVNALLKKEIESRKGSENSGSRSSFSIYNVKMLYHLWRKY